MAKKKRKIPKTVQDSIPYEMVYPNGVIETSEGVFTKAYRLEDVNFKMAPESEQTRILLAYIKFLNSFSSDINFQIVIFNAKSDKKSTLEKVMYMPARDGLNRVRSEMNNVLVSRLSNARNSLEQKKYIVISIRDNSVAHAMRALENWDTEIATGISMISRDVRTVPETSEERLRTLFEIYNQDGENIFENNMKKDGTGEFSLAVMRRQGLNTKDLIGPSALEFKYGYFRVGNAYARSFFVSSMPNWLKTDFMSDLTAIPACMLISINYDPIERSRGARMVREKMTNINAEIAGRQKEAMNSGYGFGLLSPQLDQAQKQTQELIEDILERDQSLFYATFTITVFGDTKEELEYNSKQITSLASGYMCPVRTLYMQQEDGFNASLPLCRNRLEVKRLLTSQSAAAFLPYTAQELNQKGGILYGLNETTNNLILYSRMTGRNFNGIIVGESGTGKSMFAKSEMLSVLLRNEKNRVYVIDPEGEYSDMALKLNGTMIELSPVSKTYLNPLDMDIDYDGESDPISMKTDYVIGMIDIMLGNEATLSPKAKSIVGRCVKNIYVPYLAHLDNLKQSGHHVTCDKSAMPTILNLYNELLRQEEPEARSVANVIEIYATGSLSTFSHRSNVDTSAHFVSYNINKLGTGMKNLGLHVALNDIWNKMIENSKKGEWTWIYIDEFYLLLQSDSATSFLVQIWKRARKWNGVPTGIMQNTEDLLRSANTRNIINNTSFIGMMSMPKFDRANMAELLQLPESSFTACTNAQPGHGMIYTGKTIIPFNNEYPKDSAIYGYLSTSKTKDDYLSRQ